MELVRFEKVDIGKIARALGLGEKRVVKLPVIYRPGHVRSGWRILCGYKARREVYEAPPGKLGRAVAFSEVCLQNHTYHAEFSGTCSVLLDVHCGLCPCCQTLYCCWSDRLSAASAGDFESVPRQGVELKRPPTIDEQLQHAREMVCIIESALRNGATRTYAATLDGVPCVLDGLMRHLRDWNRTVKELIEKSVNEGAKG